MQKKAFNVRSQIHSGQRSLQLNDLLPKPGSVERMCRWVPFFGWYVAHLLEERRTVSLISSLELMLSRRKSFQKLAWDEADVDEADAQKFCHILYEYLEEELPDLRTDYFHPDDEWIALLFDHFSVERLQLISEPSFAFGRIGAEEEARFQNYKLLRDFFSD